ncbi:MAG: hypothetical protein Q9209_001154 [Squamulea sp. 1 TL-2023]
MASSTSLDSSTYIYKLVAINTYLVSISSDDNLRVLDPRTLALRENINTVSRGITCLNGFQDRDFLIAGRDGLVKCLDAREKRMTFRFGEVNSTPIVSMACQENLIATGTELTGSQAPITVWDVRHLRNPVLLYDESHSDDITELSFHPSHRSILLSGSIDGLVNLYDTTITDEDDALTQVFNHGSSIAHAGFLSDDEIFALSHDEIFSIYETTDHTDAQTPVPAHVFGDLRSQLQCEYIVDLINSGSTGPVLGAGSHSLHQLDIVSLHHGSAWNLDTSDGLRLPGAHSQDVVRSMCFSNDGNYIFTGGEDGLIKAWRSSDGPPIGTFTTPPKPKHSDKKRKDYISPHKEERARFQPY